MDLIFVKIFVKFLGQDGPAMDSLLQLLQSSVSTAWEGGKLMEQSDSDL